MAQPRCRLRHRDYRPARGAHSLPTPAKPGSAVAQVKNGWRAGAYSAALAENVAVKCNATIAVRTAVAAIFALCAAAAASAVTAVFSLSAAAVAAAGAAAVAAAVAESASAEIAAPAAAAVAAVEIAVAAAAAAAAAAATTAVAAVAAPPPQPWGLAVAVLASTGAPSQEDCPSPFSDKTTPSPPAPPAPPRRRHLVAAQSLPGTEPTPSACPLLMWMGWLVARSTNTPGRGRYRKCSARSHATCPYWEKEWGAAPGHTAGWRGIHSLSAGLGSRISASHHAPRG